MTILHKIKLIFSRISWFLKFTEEAKAYHKSLNELGTINETLNLLFDEYMKSKKDINNKEKTRELVIKIELLKKLKNGSK